MSGQNVFTGYYWKIINVMSRIMSEYELYTRILAPRLKPEAQNVLIENTERKVHKAEIVSDRRMSYTLYRYDQTEQGDLFFPFFNNSHDGEHGRAECPTPEELLKFCDYILLAERNDVLYVLLVELKSGANGDAYKQLDASETFMEYVRHTANRIAASNGYPNFDARKVKMRKIVLKPAPKTRPLTNTAKSKAPQVDLKASPIYFSSDCLPLYLFCKEG